MKGKKLMREAKWKKISERRGGGTQGEASGRKMRKWCIGSSGWRPNSPEGSCQLDHTGSPGLSQDPAGEGRTEGCGQSHRHPRAEWQLKKRPCRFQAGGRSQWEHLSLLESRRAPRFWDPVLLSQSESAGLVLDWEAGSGPGMAQSKLIPLQERAWTGL